MCFAWSEQLYCHPLRVNPVFLYSVFNGSIFDNNFSQEKPGCVALAAGGGWSVLLYPLPDSPAHLGPLSIAQGGLWQSCSEGVLCVSLCERTFRRNYVRGKQNMLGWERESL